MRKGICALLSAIVIVAGCGTTHQFFPPAPLEKKQWQLTVNWHFDVGQPALTALEPELSAWYGMDQFTNLGFGAQFPCFLSNVSLSHYSRTEAGNWWMVYFTANQPLGWNNNPYLETGVSYNLIHPGYWQMHRLGVAYGHGLPVICGLFNLAEANRFQANSPALRLSKKRFMPVVGYAIGGREVAFSYVHYHGATRSRSVALRAFLQTHNDTLVYLAKDQIDSVRYDARPAECPMAPGQHLTVYQSSGDSTLIYSPPRRWRCGGCGVPFVFALNYSNQIVPGATLSSENLRCWSSSTQHAVDFAGELDSIFERWNATGVVLVTHYDPRLLEKIKQISDWSSDHSFGFGQINHIEVQRH